MSSEAFNRERTGGETVMHLDSSVRREWSERHCLSRPSLLWIDQHAEPGEAHPIPAAIAELRAERAV